MRYCDTLIERPYNAKRRSMSRYGAAFRFAFLLGTQSLCYAIPIADVAEAILRRADEAKLDALHLRRSRVGVERVVERQGNRAVDEITLELLVILNAVDAERVLARFFQRLR